MILSLILLGSSIFFPIEPEVLFIPQFPGETNEFIPVFEEMQKQGRKFHIIPLGAAKDLIDPVRFADEIIPLNENVDIPSFIKAKIVITGVHSTKQEEILAAYTKQGVKTFAYWDNPEPRGAAPYFQTALKVQKSARFLLTPSTYVASASEFADRQKDTIQVVGKPSLQAWEKEISKIDQNAVLEKLSFTKDERVVTFVGTYGESYEKAFLLLIQALNESSVKQVIFQIHPVASGTFEVEACKLLDPSIHYVLAGSKAPMKMTMAESMSVSDKVMTYNSSAGFQAFFARKDVGFVIPENDLFTNSLIDTGLAAKIDSKSDLADFLNRKKVSDPAILFKEMGIPENSPERFCQTIEEALR